MTNEVGIVSPVSGRFRPESVSHFKEVAKNMAWLLERSVQRCQEDLARIWGYSGLHELQQVLKKQGIPGPFDPRYSYLSTDAEQLVERHEQRIFYVLFGAPKGRFREDYLATDRCFLVFEMGLFQEAAEHRACFEKLRAVLSYEVRTDRWPLIHGWPLGLKSWLASGYTEPFDLAENWDKVLPRPRYAEIQSVDLRWQHRLAGLTRLAAMFQILAPRVNERKPVGMGRIGFEKFEPEGGDIAHPSWEAFHLGAWLLKKCARGDDGSGHEQRNAIQAFIQRPSRATASACEFTKGLQDPVGFRDRWAFECIKAALDRYGDRRRALFSSSLDERGDIQSLLLYSDEDSVDVGESYSCEMWQLTCTWSEVAPSASSGGMLTLQPIIHAVGALIVPFNDELLVMSQSDWLIAHDASEFASEDAALAFEDLYLPATGRKLMDFANPLGQSIVEIDELLLASHVRVEDLRAYFSELLECFDDGAMGCMPDSHGYWCKTLSLVYGDEDENQERNQNGEYAEYAYAPGVVLINVEGCGLTSVNATHRNGKAVLTLKRDEKRKPTPEGEALAAKVREATSALGVDVVIYDGSSFS